VAVVASAGPGLPGTRQPSSEQPSNQRVAIFLKMSVHSTVLGRIAMHEGHNVGPGSSPAEQVHWGASVV